MTDSGHYRRDFLKKEWKGTAREGYRYAVSHAPTSASTCRGCKEKIVKGTLRFGRSTPNPFDAEGGATDLTHFFHVKHGFDVFLRSKCTSAVPLRASDIDFEKGVTEREKNLVCTEMRRFAKEWHKKCK